MSEVKTDKISSVSTNGDITLDPDGTGDTIIASGNVGIGNSSPSHLVDATVSSGSATARFGTTHSSGDNDGTVIISNGGTGDAMLRFDYEGSNTDRARLGTTASGQGLKFFTAGVQRVEFTNEGAIDHIANTANYAYFVQNDGNNSNRYGIRITCGSDDGSGTNYLMGFRDGDGNSVGSITFSGSTTSYNTSSDHRLKENVADMTGAIARVKQLAPKRFNFIRHPNNTVDGFLAHETQTVVPEAITGTHNEVDDDGNAVYQAIDQAKLVPLLTAALKESITKIETLETEMTALKARVTALENA